MDSVWDDAAKKWRIKVDQQGVTFEDEANILVNACGRVKYIVQTLMRQLILTNSCSKRRWPNIEDLPKFKGELVHNARWCVTAPSLPYQFSAATFQLSMS